MARARLIARAALAALNDAPPPAATDPELAADLHDAYEIVRQLEEARTNAVPSGGAA